MPTENWLEINKILERNKVKRINYLGGEPTIHAGFPTILNDAKRRFKSISVQTNGATDFNWDNHEDLSVLVSLESWKEEENAKIRGKGNLEKAYKTLKNLRLLYHNPTVRITMYEDSDFIGTVAWALTRGWNVVVSDYKQFGRANDNNSILKAPSRETMFKYFRQLKYFESKYPKKIVVDMPQWAFYSEDAWNETKNNVNRNKTNCVMGIHRIVVKPTGKITPCHFFWDNEMGDVMTDDLNKVQKEVTQFRDSLMERPIISSCKNCRFLKSCSSTGCFADFIGKDERGSPNCPIPILYGDKL
jgi:radical SAM protein with 4Fe4S-binding SPASM domain